jgi:PAS domain S-box-containing protein
MTESTGTRQSGTPGGAELASTVEPTEEAIIGMTLDGVITSWNPAAARLYGYTAEEIVGCPVEVLIPPERMIGESDDLALIAEGGYVESRPTVRMRRDGVAVHVALTMSPVIDVTGEVVGATAVTHVETAAHTVTAVTAEADSDRDLLNAHLHQSQRLDNLQKLAGGVAHDFNNLLAVVLNYASFVAEELDGLAASASPEPWATIRKDVGQIQRAAERATALTHQLLAFSRREVVKPQVLDLNHVVGSVEEMLRRTLGADVELVTSAPSGLWPVLADPGQIELVLVNLAVNARDAMPEGGTLTIDTGNVTIDSPSAVFPLHAGRYVRLRVTDTGCGMSDEVARQAFEPFFTTKGEGAAGLGLATVQGVLEQAAGHIRIDSEPGLGTTFTILLPVTDRPPTPIEDVVADERTPAGETVLVVEDDDALRAVTERIFARNGYHVITAGTGREAIELARGYDEEIHLLVTDVVMPQMQGKELAEQIRAVKPDVEVLYMSGYAQPGLGIEDRLDPGAALVEKPFSEATLLAKAAQVLNPGPSHRS